MKDTPTRPAFAGPTGSALPLWKKLLVCWVLKRRQWKLAKAHNAVAASMLLTSDHATGEAVREAGDRLWADIYAPSPNSALNDSPSHDSGRKPTA